MAERAMVVFYDRDDPMNGAIWNIITGKSPTDVIIFCYQPADETILRIREELTERKVSARIIGIDGPFSQVAVSLTMIAIQSSRFTSIDVSMASRYHVGRCADLGGTDDVEICMCAEDGDDLVSMRLDRTHYIYNGVSPTDRLILDVLSDWESPMRADDVAERIAGRSDAGRNASQSAIYNSLQKLADQGLICRTSGDVPDGYRSRTPNFFTMDADRRWDYSEFKQKERERISILEHAERKASDSKESKTYSRAKKKRSRGTILQ